ncbi:MAG: phospho-N-acetylmuramoyl-pentapeptide-transferase [Candidatus Methanofastidiosum methylothiophilum]|uniref:Phospho-N-acetylmuramoyl-pentapeptide-transferase n=1 Tax=Candidatus Methanofastidiosum methylothiophilum TaxID=1705564 RepID=A0A150IWP2_9EURY|nr:MAG: phospho-N-acetylmuramoyl-pentapeptide-transferase [Candidatus Methanofastidiosum methylthiophilus]KYC47783.1 MAG: phospho-N-acetylmuramoyl-pentapeptide-transferase [Candidatus Methanofastidiosum methylthiophilus]KYC49411.1 MAG: phospho-N-acetylmuramoyl-pentapeptide-transferase [Candidatus Methanofastidiosum methylthiophilus]
MENIFIPFISMIITLVITPIIGKFNKKNGVFGVDLHKKERFDVPEAGGIALLLGTIPILSIYYILSRDLYILMFIFPVTIIGVVGLIDDLYNMPQILKTAACLLGGVPLLFFIKDTTLNLILFKMNLGLLYYIIVPIGITAASNLTNLLAGFNGEEIGLGVISTLSLSICIFLLGDIKTSIYLLTFTLAFLAFLTYNKFPAKIFPGDTGTLIVGATIASFSIIKNIEIIGAILLFPQIMEFLFKSIRRFGGKKYGPTKVDNEGILHPQSYLSVANLLTSHLKLTEKKLVLIIWFIGAIFGLISIIITYFVMVN